MGGVVQYLLFMQGLRGVVGEGQGGCRALKRKTRRNSRMLETRRGHCLSDSSSLVYDSIDGPAAKKYPSKAVNPSIVVPPHQSHPASLRTSKLNFSRNQPHHRILFQLHPHRNSPPEDVLTARRSRSRLPRRPQNSRSMAQTSPHVTIPTSPPNLRLRLLTNEPIRPFSTSHIPRHTRLNRPGHAERSVHNTARNTFRSSLKRCSTSKQASEQ